MSTTSPDHRVACHEIATTRKKAGQKVWDLKIKVGPFAEDGAPAEWCRLLHDQIKASRWPAAALAASDEEYFDNTALGELLDEIDWAARCGDETTEGYSESLMSSVYDEADLGDVRVWITMEQP